VARITPLPYTHDSQDEDHLLNPPKSFKLHQLACQKLESYPGQRDHHFLRWKASSIRDDSQPEMRVII
jgi:hypothetical protein